MYFFIALSTISSILFTFLFTRNWIDPEKYETIKYILCWYGLKTYTKINMYVKKIYKIKHYFYSTNDDIIDIYFISNGHRVDKIYNKNTDLYKIPTYDFICYEFNKEDEPKYLIIRDKISNEKVEDIEKSNVRFLSPQIIINNSSTLIEFTQNIYLVNNKIFSRPFITWYMNEFHDTFVDNKQDYVIRFFDNKMDFIEINSEQCIILGKDTYEIVKYERTIETAESETAESACETEETAASETAASETAESETAESETAESETAASACETEETAESETAESEAEETAASEAEESAESETAASEAEEEEASYITQERGC